MFKLDDNLLIELGLGSLPPVEKNRMLSHIYETLEMRVGMKLAQKMTNEQLDEFEAFINRNDEPGALKWLESNFPNYKQVVADELDALKGEIKTAAPQIVAASHQQALNQGQTQPAPQTQAPVDPAYAPAQTYSAAPPAQPAFQPQYTQPTAETSRQVPPAPASTAVDPLSAMPQYPPAQSQPSQPQPAPQYPPLPPSPMSQPSPPDPYAPNNQYRPASTAVDPLSAMPQYPPAQSQPSQPQPAPQYPPLPPNPPATY